MIDSTRHEGNLQQRKKAGPAAMEDERLIDDILRDASPGFGWDLLQIGRHLTVNAGVTWNQPKLPPLDDLEDHLDSVVDNTYASLIAVTVDIGPEAMRDTLDRIIALVDRLDPR